MKPPCEIVVSKMLPQIRAGIVKILIQDYHMKQIEVSKILGITQASVSQYLSSNRGGGDEFQNIFPEIMDYAKEIADKIASGKDTETQVALLCEICMKIRVDEKFCNYHKSLLNLKSCGICYGSSTDEVKSKD